ncbi:MAG: hypothetical protein CMG66_06690 [Candidatus Marinimicrobia bacterium]|nr:hypothetical protein [Candidatus Neomarinimicrobiota bacterium]|tara:strand:- start:18431 stop:18745 length:315 start_codon:yes stop_codon:yes gene_type:complete
MKKNILEDIAYARSGDKGPNANVGVVFKDKVSYDWGLKKLTSSTVKEYFGTMVKGQVERYELPNLYALNFILNDSLQGGGSETLINDAQGKTFGQAILMMQIDF